MRPTPPTTLFDEAKKNPGGWVYEILGPYGPNDYVPPEAIIRAYKVGEDGELTGEVRENPNFGKPAKERKANEDGTSAHRE